MPITEKSQILPIMVLLFGCPLLLTGCPRCLTGSPVTVPNGDSTPPTAGMTANFSTNKPMLTVSSGGADVSGSISRNDIVSLIATGSDPDGVQDIQIWVEETWWYNQNGFTKQVGPGLLGAPESSSPDSTKPGGQACPTRLLGLNLDITTRSKQADQYRIRTWATGVNFSGTKVNTSVLTLRFP